MENRVVEMAVRHVIERALYVASLMPIGIIHEAETGAPGRAMPSLAANSAASPTGSCFSMPLAALAPSPTGPAVTLTPAPRVTLGERNESTPFWDWMRRRTSDFSPPIWKPWPTSQDATS